MWLGIGLLVVWQAFYALAPPVKWDTLAYHLELPKQYLAEGRYLFLVDNPLWGRSQIVEVLYTWAMSLRGLETATMLAWCFGVVFIVGVFGYVQQLVSASAGVVAVTAIMAGYTFRGMLSWGYVDALVALYGFAVLVLSLSAEESPEKEWFTWVGVFCGLALGVKFTCRVAFTSRIFEHLFSAKLTISLVEVHRGGYFLGIANFPTLAFEKWPDYRQSLIPSYLADSLDKRRKIGFLSGFELAH